jgi:RNA-directed DNA polymerase
MTINFPKGQLIKEKSNKKAKRRSRLLLQESPEGLGEKFYALKTPGDVANLLNVSYPRLVYHIYLVTPSRRYKTFEIPKKSGGTRQISTPITALKILQWKLNQVLQAVYEPKPSAHGFVQGKNIVTNAQAHAKKRYVLNIDLKDFFPSINFGRVRGMFMATPYGLNAEVATVLAQICCHNNQLPQGAPTSPVITNMLCAKMDSQFQRLAKECKATYTRYADDITFSTTLPKFPEALARIVTEEEEQKVILGEPLLAIIADNGFEVNEPKIRLQTRSNHQEVTGLTINQFPNVDRRFVRQVRAMLHAWAKFGLAAADKEYHEKFESKARLSVKGIPTFKQVLRGKIEFIGMVKGKKDPIYKKSLKQYKSLSSFSLVFEKDKG